MTTQHTIAILGLGVSGLAAARALPQQGMQVLAWDDRKAARDQADPAIIAPLTDANIPSCTVLIAAPGIDDAHPVIQTARKHGVEVICDIEMWRRLNLSAKTIGITGTNGKSTVTAMIQHVLQTCGVKAQMGGNIGKAIFDLSPPAADQWTVIEMSSYQIERCPFFRPDISVLLNITPDHLDRHGTMDNYAAIKARLCEDKGHAVIITADAYSTQIAQMTEAAGLRTVKRITKQGGHSAQNTDAVKAVADILSLKQPDVQAAIDSFQPLPHRQCPVRTIDAVTFINDSKATNTDAALQALNAFEDIIWIVGGQAKQGGLNGLENALSNVRHACIIGKDMEGIAAWLTRQNIPFTPCGTMKNAITQSWLLAQNQKVKTILLAPACASFDQYTNFEARGADFEAHVKAIAP